MFRALPETGGGHPPHNHPPDTQLVARNRRPNGFAHAQADADEMAMLLDAAPETLAQARVPGSR